jgi:AraC-like DNA-binding protein
MEYERDVLIFNEHALYNSTVAELSMLTQPATKSGVIHFSDENKIAAISAIFKQMKNTEVMFEGRKNRKAKEETMLSSLLTQLLLILSLEDSITSEGVEDDLMHKVMSYVNRHLFDELSLDKISQRFFVSKFYLCRAFKEYAGISLFSYITAKRIVMADQLIERGEPATDVAYKVGFGSYSSFYRAYVKQNGHPPVREYTKKQMQAVDNHKLL